MQSDNRAVKQIVEQLRSDDRAVNLTIVQTDRRSTSRSGRQTDDRPHYWGDRQMFVEYPVGRSYGKEDDRSTNSQT